MGVSPSPKALALQSAVGRIQNRYGAAALQSAAAPRALRSGEADESFPDGCPTGITQLDSLTGVGGIPRGRLSLCLGPAGSGKMLVGYHFLARASQDCAAVLMLDTRGHADPWLMTRLGTNLDRVLILRTSGDIKPALEATLALLRAGVGSVLADLPDAAGSSSLWDPFASALAASCARAGAPLLMLAESVAEPLRYAASLVLRLRRQEWLLRHGDIDGVRLAATVEKNKVGMPGAGAEFVLRYPYGTYLPPAS